MIQDTIWYTIQKKLKKKTESQFNSHLDNFVYQQCTTKTPSFAVTQSSLDHLRSKIESGDATWYIMLGA